jgi:hypothetical protein
VNPAQLGELFTKHKTAVFGVAAVGVTGVALLHRKKAGAAAAGGPSTSPAGTIPAAAVVPGAGGGYDSSAYDVYSALQSQLAPILEQQRRNSVTTAPSPTASDLFKPGFYRNAAGKGIYQLDTQGNRDLLTPVEYRALGRPAATAVAKDSTFWQLTKPIG